MPKDAIAELNKPLRLSKVIFNFHPYLRPIIYKRITQPIGVNIKKFFTYFSKTDIIFEERRAPCLI